MDYFITGGAGSFGKRFTRHIIETTDSNVTIFSRDELKHFNMKKWLPSDRVKYVVGDVRDRDAVMRAMPDACFVVHAAALKHVLTGEQQAWEVVKTNVAGTRNVVDAANAHNCIMVLVSTDKAVEPINLYGATKMCAEKITLQGGQRVARWGNVFGSSGSILHIFKQQFADGHKFTITDHRMTRFVITFDQAIKICEDALKTRGGEITVPRLPAMCITDLAKAFDKDAEFEEIGIQPGEKLAEVLQVSPRYSSDTADKLSIGEIKELIDASF